MDGVIECKVSNFSNCCVAASMLQELGTVVFMLDQRDIAAVDDKGRAHCIAGQILGALKEGNSFNHRRLSRLLNHGCIRAPLVLFIDTEGPEWRSERQRRYSSYSIKYY